MGNDISLRQTYEVQSQPYYVCGHYAAYSCCDMNLRPLTLFVFDGNEANFDINVSALQMES